MDKYLVLVNKKTQFDEDMIKDFQMAQIPVNMSKNKEFVDVTVYEAFKALKKQLLKKGISATVNSAGRTVEEQTEFMNEQIKQLGEKEALEIVAKPGESEHHLGLALDVNLDSFKAKIERKINPEKAKDMRNKMYEYMNKILSDFGFILRYPKDKEVETGYPFERWHIRYVGVENAKQMEDLNMTLEEYVKYIKEQENLISL